MDIDGDIFIYFLLHVLVDANSLHPGPRVSCSTCKFQENCIKHIDKCTYVMHFYRFLLRCYFLSMFN